MPVSICNPSLMIWMRVSPVTRCSVPVLTPKSVRLDGQNPIVSLEVSKKGTGS